jgi:hypothetical protein
MVFCSALLVGFCVGAVTGSRVIEDSSVFISSATLYFLFLRPVRSLRLAHIATAWFAVEAMDWAIPLALGASPSELLSEWGSTARHLGSAMLAFCAAKWLAKRRHTPA